MLPSGDYFEVAHSLPVDPIDILPGGPAPGWPTSAPIDPRVAAAGIAGGVAVAVGGGTASAAAPTTEIVETPPPVNGGWTQNQMLAAGGVAVLAGGITLVGVAALAWWATQKKGR